MKLVHDTLGRLEEVRYPEVPGRQRFVLKHVYDGATGELTRRDDATDPLAPSMLWQVDAREVDGSLAHATYGTGGVDVALTRQYDPATGRLEHIDMRAVGAGGAASPLHAMAYHYTAGGAVDERIDEVAQRRETFGYDASDRLTSWTVESLTGAFPTRQTVYDFDDLGNLEQVLEDGLVVDTMTYGWGGKPHVLASKNGQAYGYDAKGRQVDGPERTIGFSASDLPKTVQTKGSLGTTTTYTYDAGGTRVRKRTPSEETTYVGGLYEQRKALANGPQTEHVFYVPGESGVALQVTYEEATGAERRDVVAEDALGTVSGVIDAAGVVSEKRYYDPYGKKVLADGAAAPTNGPVSDLRRGFTGHEEDAESGLTNMRGRMYDPGQRRFVTPDPFVSDPFFGQGLNRYAYVTNNPLRWVDPSGFTATKMGEEGVASSSTSADGILYFADDNLRGNAPDGGAPSEEGAAKSNPPSTQKADAAKTTTPTGPAKASPVKSTEEGPPIGPPRPPEPPTAAPPTYVGPSGKGWTIQPESGRDRRQRYADGVDKVVKNYVPLVFSAANPLSAVKALLHVTSGHEEPIVDAAIDVVPVIVGAGVSSLSPAAAEKLLSDALRGGNAGTLRGINRFGGVVSSTGNTAGGVVVTAEGSVQGVDFAGHVNAGLMRGGPVNILSGVHGSEAGIMTADAAIFAEDVAMFGRMEGVTIHDTASLSAAEVGGMLNGPGTTIGAFCNSGACLAPFR